MMKRIGMVWGLLIVFEFNWFNGNVECYFYVCKW